MQTPDNDTPPITRRDFVRTAALAATAVGSGLGLASTGRAAANDPAAAGQPMIGFQAEVPYLLEYGIVQFLDDVQARASVNTDPFEASSDGNFATAHPEFYQDVGMKPQGLVTGDFNLPDAMQKITAETKKRGMKVFPWMEEDNRAPPRIAGFDQLYEIDLYGRRTAGHRRASRGFHSFL